jgi:hypothetical protein
MLAMDLDGQTILRSAASSCPFSNQLVSPFTSATFQSMTSFDPSTVRKAVEEFTPRRPQKFQDLLPAKDFITELRQKRASYRSIAELLTQHCLPVSKTAIAVFCHEVLGENVRPRRRPGRKRPLVPASPNADAPIAAPSPARNGDPTEVPANSNGETTLPTRIRGPRIAQVRMLKPESI